MSQPQKTEEDLQNEIKLNQAKTSLMRMKDTTIQQISQQLEQAQKEYEASVEEKNKQQSKAHQKGQDPMQYLLQQLKPLKDKLKVIIDKINENKKLNPQEKQKFLPVFQGFHALLSKTKSFMSIKVQDLFFKGKLDKTVRCADEMQIQLDRLNNAGCCGAGSLKKGVDLQYNEIKILYENFWQALTEMKLNAKEGIEYVPFNINLSRITQLLKQSLQQLEVVTFDKVNTKTVTETEIKYEIKYKEAPVQVKVQQEVQKVEVEKKIFIKEGEVVKEAYELLYGLGRPQQVPQGIKLLEQEADKGDLAAINTLGKLYQDGDLVQQDLDKAFEYYNRASQKDSSEGIYRIGQLYETGQINQLKINQQHQLSEQERIIKAVEYYEKAAIISQKQGNPHLDSITDLGYIFEHGYPQNSQNQIIPSNTNKAKTYYDIGKDNNYPRALNNLGRLYQSQNQKHTAFLLFQRATACLSGYPRASYNLGVCYQKGYGTQIDQKKAKFHFKKAYEKGDLYGKLSYAYYMLQEASETDDLQQYRQVYRMYREVLQQDDQMGEAYYYLGYMYENGFGVSPCEGTALEYYETAANTQYPKALNKLGEIHEDGQFGIEQNQEEALRYYDQAQQLNDDNAMVNLGRYEENKDTEKGYENAYKWYKKAAQNGNHRAQTLISELYRQGKGVEKDEELAFEYLQLGAKKDGNAQYLLEQLISQNIQEQLSTAGHSGNLPTTNENIPGEQQHLQEQQQQIANPYGETAKPDIKFVQSTFPSKF